MIHLWPIKFKFNTCKKQSIVLLERKMSNWLTDKGMSVGLLVSVIGHMTGKKTRSRPEREWRCVKTESMGSKFWHFLLSEHERKWLQFRLYHGVLHPEKPHSWENGMNKSLKCRKMLALPGWRAKLGWHFHFIRDTPESHVFHFNYICNSHVPLSCTYLSLVGPLVIWVSNEWFMTDLGKLWGHLLKSAH